jgi:hypothetical protein
MRNFQLGVAMALLLGLLFAVPAAAHKGMGEPIGVARQAVKPPIETLSGTIRDIKIGPYERTTGRSLEGVHLIVQAESGKTIFARDNLAAPGLYGCYGGLHLSIFDTWKPKFDSIIDEVKALGMEKMGCDHCTGWMWAEKAASHGVPIIKGTDAYLSYRSAHHSPRQPCASWQRR